MKRDIDNIWLVDDDEIYQYITKTYFEFEGPKRNISIFKSGKAAIENLLNDTEENGLPDIILLDINMPVMNGWEFMNEYKKIKPSLKKQPSIFLVSSSENSNDLERADSDDEIKDYILKPVDDAKIKKIIKIAAE